MMLLPIALLFALRLAPENPEAKYAQPQIAVEGNRVALTFGSGSTVYYSGSKDGGRVFSSPVPVAKATFLALGRHRGPRIAITPQGIVISAIVGEQRGRDGDLVAWRSGDDGKTWSQGIRINTVPGAAREGLHGMASGGAGLVFATWLDLRENRTKLLGAVSKDGGATWTDNVLVYDSPDGHICECCHPSALVGSRGELYAMWRNWLGGSRDMYVAASKDGGKSFQSQKLGEGTWPLKACPMDGGGFLVDAKGQIHSIWRRESTVYATAGGQTEAALGPGKDASLALGKAGVYAAWTTGSGLMLKRPGKDAEPLAAEGGFVTLAGQGPVIAAWEDKGAIVVREVGP